MADKLKRIGFHFLTWYYAILQKQINQTHLKHILGVRRWAGRKKWLQEKKKTPQEMSCSAG